jgi:hypothetical protein
MTYTDFKQAIHARLREQPAGMTWKQLKAELRLPYDRPCPEWTRRLEGEIDLVRRKRTGKELIWALEMDTERWPFFGDR